MSRRRFLVPALLGALAIAAAVPGYWATQSIASDHDRMAARALDAAHADATSARQDADARLLTAAAEAMDGNPALSDDDVTAALLRVAPQGRVILLVRTTTAAAAPVAVAVPPGTGGRFVGRDLAQEPNVQLALALARDSGSMKVGRGQGVGGKAINVEAQPLYGTPDQPLDVAAKRTALQGFVVTVAPVDPPVVAQAATDRPGWLLPSAVAAALAVVIVARRREWAGEHAEQEAAARAEEMALVARMGPMLQQSLTLSELLPLFVVEVSAEFQLASASIWLARDGSALTRVFSVGTDATLPEIELDAFTTDADAVAPDGFVHVALERGGRTIGMLRARATHGMSRQQVDGLVAVSNMLAAALGNAQLFEEEQRMVAQLRDIDAMKIAFVGSVSHELRTSATAIEGFAGLLDNDRLASEDPRRGEYVQRIRRNARSLGLLVEDLLDFARLEKAGGGPALKRIELSAIVPEVVDQLSPILTDHEMFVDVVPGIAVDGDLSMVERILSNLLSNAAKYTPAGTPIAVTLRAEHDDAVLTVEDHGNGIPEAERERVFQLFYRIEDPAARAVRGVGIGLALVRQLVEQIHGTVSIHDTPGGGATFRVTIPLYVEAPAEEAPPNSVTITQGG